MNIDATIKEIEGQIEVLTRALDALRPLSNGHAELPSVNIQEAKAKPKRPKAISGPTLMDIVFNAVKHGNHDFHSVYSWVRKHGGLQGRRRLSIGPALASLKQKGMLVRLSPGVYHIPPVTHEKHEDNTSQS